MTHEEAIAKLKELQGPTDWHVFPDGDQHIEADDILCELLKTLDCADVVAEWEKVPKWYA